MSLDEAQLQALAAYLQTTPEATTQANTDTPVVTPEAIAQIIGSDTSPFNPETIINTIIKEPPFDLPDKVLFKLGDTDIPVHTFAGLVVPVALSILILLLLRNCYGYVFLFLWLIVGSFWAAAKSFLFTQELPFQSVLNLLAKSFIIALAAIFATLTVGAILLVNGWRILKFIFSLFKSNVPGVATAASVATAVSSAVASPPSIPKTVSAPAAQPVAQPAAEPAPVPQPAPAPQPDPAPQPAPVSTVQQGGSRSLRAPRMIYIGRQ